MALIAYDGFDQYGSPNDVLGRRGGGLQWNQQNLITVTSPGRNNSPQCIGLGQNAYLYGTLTNPITSGYFGFGVYISTVNYPASPQLRLMDLHAGNNPQLTFVFNIETAGIDVYRNSGNSLDPTTNSVLIASSINNSITLDVWNYVEFFVTIDRTAGAVRIRSNGEDKLNASGLNTQPINQPGHNYFEGMWFFGGGAPCGTTLEIDDFYIADSSSGSGVFPFNFFAGDAKIVTLYPVGNAGTPQWTPLAGGVPHRYWRLNVRYPSFGTYSTIAEVQFRSTAGVSQPLTGGTASSSTVTTGHAASAAADGNATTYFQTGGNPSSPWWWQYDFGAGSSRACAEVAITSALPASPYTPPTDFDVQWSDDGTNFSLWNTYSSFPAWDAGTQTTQTFAAPTANWQQVDEVHADGDVSYNYTATVGAKDMFNFQQLPNTIATVLAVQVVGCYRKDDAGSRTISQHVLSAGTEVAGPGYSIPGNYAYCSDFYTLDPATGNAWSVAAVNAVQAGYDLVS